METVEEVYRDFIVYMALKIANLPTCVRVIYVPPETQLDLIAAERMAQDAAQED